MSFIQMVKDAKSIFSHRIFDSQKYSNEQLTVFSTSLIEETVTSGKMYLSGKYTGAYILVHPDYQGGTVNVLIPFYHIFACKSRAF